mgnify:CR=1 FL=1
MFDKAIGGLLKDLKQRGMLDDTLVILRHKLKAGIEVTPARVEKIEKKGGVLLLSLGDRAKTVTKARRAVVAIGRTGRSQRS